MYATNSNFMVFMSTMIIETYFEGIGNFDFCPVYRTQILNVFYLQRTDLVMI